MPVGQLGAGLVAHHLPVLAQGAFAVAGDLVAVLAEEDQHRHAVAAVDLQLRLHVGMLVAVEVADLDHRGGGGEVLEDRDTG